MNKAITVASVILALGIAMLGYTLWQIVGHIPSVPSAAAPVARASDSVPAAPAARRVPEPARVAPAATETVELSPDEESPFGHDAGEQPQNAVAEFAGAEAPDTEVVPTTREAETAALEDARATLQALLENPDPNVRSEAAAILERIDSRAPR